MDAVFRVVTRLPLEQLWRGGSTIGSRRHGLNADEISQLLREGSVEFVVADPGRELRWIAAIDCYGFWRTEVKPHLAATGAQMALDQFADAFRHKSLLRRRSENGYFCHGLLLLP